MASNPAPNIEISQLIDERKLSSLQITVIILSALVVWLDGYHIQSMALIVPTLSAQWSIKSADFSLVLTSALLGIAIGGAFLAPLGDRFGRRILLISSTAFLGLASIGTSFAGNPMQLLIWRFLTGLALGASLTNATALTTEYLPSKRRAALVTLMFSGISIGAFTAGFVAPIIIDKFGWEGMFTIGGAIPLLLSLVLAASIPESIKLLLASRPNDPRAPKILVRLAPGIDPRTVYAKKQEIHKQSVTELLNATYRRGTLLLWMVFIFNMFVLYLLVNWLPTLLTTQGWTASQAPKGAVMIQAGGLAGGLILSWCVYKGKTVMSMLAAYIITAAALGLFSILPSSGPSWWVLLLLVGCGISGSQFVLNALSAIYYPPLIRATGIGWAAGIGRIGAVLSPMIGGWIIKMQVAPSAVLGMLVIPVAICAAGVLMFRRVFQTSSENP
ncbi:MAG: aromatic acid/H+ symport family MFS transporter [Acidobacteria bacterium]|nr:aromatic acid/H+ symport family MFS transporter [Acidobacteriota bacterium]